MSGKIVKLVEFHRCRPGRIEEYDHTPSSAGIGSIWQCNDCGKTWKSIPGGWRLESRIGRWWRERKSKGD